MPEDDKDTGSKFPKLTVPVTSKDISKKYKKAENATLRHARRFVFKRYDNFRVARKFIALWVLLVGLVIGATGLQFFWYQQSYITTATARGGTYAEAVQGPIESLNPLFTKSPAEEAVSKLVFSRLLRFDESGSVNYDLAEKMKVSEDGKKYTLSIRPDAKWHDGLYVRARDVVFTVNLVKNNLVRSSISGWNNVKVAEVDSKTVSFELPSVYAPFPQALAQLAILPEHSLRDIEPGDLANSSFNMKPVGSGPFSVLAVQDVSGSDVKVAHLVKSNDYYRGRVNLDRFQLYAYKDVDSLKKALTGGEVVAATGFSVSDSQSLDQKRFIVDKKTINTGVYAIFNTTSPGLSDAKVRKALQVGTDMKKVRDALSEDTVALDLPFMSNLVSGGDIAVPAHNVAEAGKLLDEAGWKLSGKNRMKDSSVLQLSVVTTKNNDYEKILNELVSQWRSLGLTITTNIVDMNDPNQNVAQEILQPRKFDVLLYPLTIGGDPDVYAYWHSSQSGSGYNFANYKNAISDEALSTARVRLERDLRNAKYHTFAKQWLHDAPALGIYQATSQYVHTRGAKPSAPDFKLVSASDRYGDVVLWSVGERRAFKTP